MVEIRTVLIGYGGMGRQDAALLHSGAVNGMRLIGICCRNPEGQADIAARCPDVRIYENADAMFADAHSFDALIIVTPHKTHADLASRAMQLGKHVLVDKPLGISTGEVRKILALAEEKQTACGTIFNMRAYPAYQKAKEFMEQGKLGKLHRAVWVANSWYRSPAYHSSSKWRSTWDGECGGLLINQCQHSLDIWQWLLGMPDRIYASIDYGKYNDFRVDDAVDIQMEYADGFHGTFIASSGEAPGVNRLEIWGSKGRLCIEDNLRLTFCENTVDIETFAAENKEIYAVPPYTSRQIPVREDYSDSYQILFQKFSDHIRHGTSLLASGEDGLNVLLLSGAAYISSWQHESICLPFEDAAYDAFLAQMLESER